MKKATKKRPPGSAGSSASAGRSGETRAPGERPEAPAGPRPVAKAGAPAKKVKKAAKKRPPGERPSAPGGSGGEARPSSGARSSGGVPGGERPAKKAGAPAKKVEKAAKKRPQRPTSAPRPAPALHDWANDDLADDDWGDDDGDATAAVPAAELLSPSSPSVVVHGVPTPDPVGFDDLAVGGPPLGAEPDLPLAAPSGREPFAPPAPEQPGPEQRLTRSGKPKKLRGKAKRIEKARSRPPSRLLNHYDVNGPRIRLGFLWFCLVVLTIGAETATDLPLLAVVYGVAAGFAGWQAAREWRKDGNGAVPWAAAAVGLGVGLAGSQTPQVVGVVAVLGLGVAALGAIADDRAREALLGNVGLTVQSGLFVGLAAASVPLVWQLEPGAAISLILLVSAYEVGDYVVGSGSLNAFEGPIAGVLAVAAVMLPLYAVSMPPIDPDSFLAYGLIVALGCPLGQIAGSAVLPWSDAPAPAVRRLDSLLIAGPVWLAAVGIQQSAF